MLELLIGCPVYKRDWILPQWFEYVEAACEVAGVIPVYAFVWEPRDAPTIAVIRQQIHKYQREYWYRSYAQEEGDDGKHRWNRERYMQMVEIRNTLLGLVRSCAPQHFLSLDSDILINSEAIKGMLQHIEKNDAVGAKTYLSARGVQCPSYASRIANGLYRPDTDGVVKAKVLMAIKMMNPSAYACDYRYHTQGEDIGIAKAWEEAGLRLTFDGRYPSKHIMERAQLDKVDPRVGY